MFNSVFVGDCREVEDFARRLNSDWLSLGQQQRLVPNIVNGNGSLQRYSGFFLLS